MKASIKNPDTLCLQTNLARSLFNPEPRLFKIGFLQFAGHITRVYSAYQKDDPYAEWMLMQTYDALINAFSLSKEMEHLLHSYLNNLRGIKLGSFTSNTKWEKPLVFSNLFPYLAASLLGDVDYLLQQLLMLNRYEIVQTGREVTKTMVVQLIKSVFYIPMKWKNTGITRQDIHERNEKSLEAIKKLTALIEKFGDLPEDVLHKNETLFLLMKKREHLDK